MESLRVAIAGCGMIAGGPVRDGRPIVGNHAEACATTPGAELVAAADPSEQRRVAFRDQWRVTRVYADVTTLLGEARPDILIVATPPLEHEAICRAAIRAGVRGILCEKPFTGRRASAAAIVDEASRAGVHLAVNFTRRWDDSHAALAARVRAGEIGDVRAIHAVYTGTLRGNGSHLVDTIRMLVPGEWSVDWTTAMSGELDDGPVSALLTLEDGRDAALSAVRGAEYFVFEIDVVGTRGRARLAFGGNEIRIQRPMPHPDYPGYQYLRDVETLPRTLPGAFARVLGSLATAVRTGLALPVAAGESVRTLALVDRLIECAHTKGH